MMACYCSTLLFLNNKSINAKHKYPEKLKGLNFSKVTNYIFFFCTLQEWKLL